MDEQIYESNNESQPNNITNNEEETAMTNIENTNLIAEETSIAENISVDSSETTLQDTSEALAPASADETHADGEDQPPKRSIRRKKAQPELETAPVEEVPAESENHEPEERRAADETVSQQKSSAPTKRERDAQAAARRREQRRRLAENAVLDEDGNAILSGDGSYNETIAELYRVQNMHQIVSGKIDQVRQGRASADGYVEVAYKGFRVLIPFSQMDIGIEPRTDEDARAFKNREYGIISNMLGAKIDFILLRVELEDGICAGSRLAATRRKRERILNAKDTGGNFLVCPGRRVEARVLSVQEKYAYVEVYGMRTTISVRDVRAEYIRDMVEEIQAGDVLTVYITAIERGDKGEATSLAISMRNDEQEKRELERVAESLQIGDTCRGRVSSVNNRSFFIRLQNGLNAFCFVSRGLQGRLIPRVGDTVAVEILEKRVNKSTGMPLMVVKVKRNITYTAR